MTSKNKSDHSPHDLRPPRDMAALVVDVLRSVAASFRNVASPAPVSRERESKLSRGYRLADTYADVMMALIEERKAFRLTEEELRRHIKALQSELASVREHRKQLLLEEQAHKDRLDTAHRCGEKVEAELEACRMRLAEAHSTIEQMRAVWDLREK